MKGIGLYKYFPFPQSIVFQVFRFNQQLRGIHTKLGYMNWQIDCSIPILQMRKLRLNLHGVTGWPEAVLLA